MTRYTFILTLVLLAGYTCRAQVTDAPSKQEIVQLAHQADGKVTNFEQANLSAQPYISQAAFEKDLEHAAAAHKAVAVLSSNPPSAYASAELLIALDELAIDAASHARAIYSRGMSTAASGQTVNLNALAAAESLTKAQSALTEISESVGHATLHLIAAEEKSNHEVARLPTVSSR
jgi:hypothetical protein